MILTGYTSINAIVKAELFPSHVRALGVGFGLRAGQLRVRRHRAADLPGRQDRRAVGGFIVYVTVAIAVSLLVYIFALRNKAETDLDREQGSSPLAGVR